MTGDVNWGLVIAAGLLVGLLILVLIAGLYLLLNPPPVSEPLGTPDGMLTYGRPGAIIVVEVQLAQRYTSVTGSIGKPA